MNTFGSRLKGARQTAGLTQKQLAKLAGLSQTTISDIERDRNSGSGEVVTLARVLGVSAEYLANNIGPMIAIQQTQMPTKRSDIPTIEPKTKRAKRIAGINRTIENISTEGLIALLEKAKDLAKDYPAQAQQTAS